jgi:thymidylate synthase
LEFPLIKTEEALIGLYQVLREHGTLLSPRGEQTLEIENFTYSVAPFVRFNSFEGRNFNLSYLKREFTWYVRANPFDLSIANHAAQWGKIVANGKLNSNYGSYWFGTQGVKYIMQTLQADPMSRRAVIPMYGTDLDHTAHDAKDVPCTIAIEFRIRNCELHTRVIMRSQDILWGMANDLPTFSFLQELVAVLLNVSIGTLTVSVGSFHVYESRMEMFNSILSHKQHVPLTDLPPRISRYEAHQLIEQSTNPRFGFSKWLLNV